jgi:large subunit ribosomal protein L21
MKYAILALQGKQYKVSEGQQLIVDKLAEEVGSSLALDQVILLVDGDKRVIGQPYVPGAQVTAEVVEQTRDKKIRVATYKAKSRYRRVIGHRQYVSKLLIKIISGSQPEKAKAKASSTKKTTKATN